MLVSALGVPLANREESPPRGSAVNRTGNVVNRAELHTHFFLVSKISLLRLRNLSGGSMFLGYIGDPLTNYCICRTYKLL